MKKTMLKLPESLRLKKRRKATCFSSVYCYLCQVPIRCCFHGLRNPSRKPNLGCRGMRFFPQQFFDDFPGRKPGCNNFVEVFDDCHGADVGMGSWAVSLVQQTGGSHRNKNPWPPWMNTPNQSISAPNCTVLLTRITGPFLCPVITLNQNVRCISL